MRKMNSLALIVASAALLSACTTPMKTETKVEERPMETTKAPDPDKGRTVTPVAATPVVDGINDPKLAKRSVYFDFDSYVVRDDGKPVVQNHADFLNKNKGRKVLIQGNTDERGGTEYNLALGQKRAEAVRKAMGALGVADGQMEAVSLGKEKPKAMGSNEEAWAENRRADIVY